MRHAFAWSVVTCVTGAAAVAAAAIPAMAATSPQAGSHNSVVYVSPNGRAGAHDTNCNSAAFRSIGPAVSAVSAGGKVVVCGGIYREDVALAKPLSLLGESHPVIDAFGKINGILVTAAHVTVRGFTVMNATGEGILVNSANYATIAGNVVTQNDLGGGPSPVPASYPECKPVGQIPGDCGEGIHLMGSSHSTVAGNVIKGNSGGILLSDETGPTAHNRIAGNVVTGNLSDCGITITGHNPHAAPKGVPAPRVAGVYANDIVGNEADGNGTTGQGAGVLLATGLPGGAVYDNTVEGNSISGNGISGVTVHSHVPGEFLNGNVITGNVIGTNNSDGDNDFAPHKDDNTTGVLVATVNPLSIKVTGNLIFDNHFGLWTTGPVSVAKANNNTFLNDAVSVAKG